MSFSSKIAQLWGDASKGVQNAQDFIKSELISKIANEPGLQEAWKMLMLSSNIIPVAKSRGEYTPVLPSWLNNTLVGTGSVIGIANAFVTSNISSVLGAATGLSTVLGGNSTETLSQVLMMPNIEGIPISSNKVITSRSADTSEQVLIVQSTAQKKYWTDNVVPHLKEWQINGFITSSLSIDQGFVIKPSLDLQLKFLDICMLSRRPVLFKNGRGEFIFVQITNLQTVETPEYNNGIEITVSLKEYVPYEVTTEIQEIDVAVQDLSELEMLQNIS